MIYGSPILSVSLVTIHPRPRPLAPSATTRTSKGMDWGKVARNHHDKAHGSPHPERVTGDDPPTAYATCTDSDSTHQQGHGWGQEGTPPPRQSSRRTPS